MTKGGKSGVVSDVSKGKAVAEKKGKRFHFRTRVGMDFDPRTTKLYSRKDVGKYWPSDQTGSISGWPERYQGWSESQSGGRRWS